MNYPITEPALRWLELIFSERFDYRWRLARAEEGLRLELIGAEGAIVFDTHCNDFTASNRDLKHTNWDASCEGWNSVLGGPLPAPGFSELLSPLIEQQAGSTFIHYDIIGLVYWMLARVEEIGRDDLDIHGRFPVTSSHAYKNGYLDRPVVDEWFHILGQVIKRQWPPIELKLDRASIELSHDVDRPFQYLFAPGQSIARQVVGDVLKRWDIGLAVRRCLTWHAVRKGSLQSDPYNTFDWIMDKSEKYGLRSTFYFICGRTNKAMDADYEIEHPEIRRLLRRIHERGHEIGLHPSYDTYLRPDLIRREFLRLKQVCEKEGIQQDAWGGRMHYLRFQVPTTMNALVEAGLDYDSSLGYADRAGFRCGTSISYQAFDVVAGVSLNLRIRPLIAMEASVFGLSNQGIDWVGGSTQVCRLQERCRASGGQISLLWHNSELSTQIARFSYQDLLRRINA